jgi:arabinose-5-phosphate isomerase
MRDKKISELPIIDRGGRPVGLVDLTDLIDLVPGEADE